jgi:hypothetical protein
MGTRRPSDPGLVFGQEGSKGCFDCFGNGRGLGSCWAAIAASLAALAVALAAVLVSKRVFLF